MPGDTISGNLSKPGDRNAAQHSPEEAARIAEARERITARRELEAHDKSQKESTRSRMFIRWGREEYRNNISLIRSYLDGLPAQERERIENETRPDGSLALNDPERIEELAALARKPKSLKAGLTPEEEIAEIRRRMKEDRRAYNRDPALQARYRDLLRAQGE